MASPCIKKGKTRKQQISVYFKPITSFITITKTPIILILLHLVASHRKPFIAKLPQHPAKSHSHQKWVVQ